MKRNFTKELIQLLLEALNGENKCERCGKPNVSVNHVIPIFKGGKNELSNIEFLCPKCMKDTNDLGFKHGNKKDYMRKYMKWYFDNNPEQRKKIRERNRRNMHSKRSKRMTYYPFYHAKLCFQRWEKTLRVIEGLICEKCKKGKMVKNGKRRTRKGLSQRWTCIICGRNKYVYD